MALKITLLVSLRMLFRATSLRRVIKPALFEVDHDHIIDDSNKDSKPGSPVVSMWDGEPLFEMDQWRVKLGERLWVAAKVEEEVLHKCGGFVSFGDATWCKKALPTQYEKDDAMRGVHVYDLGEVIQTDAQEKDFVALSYGIEGGDLWSMYMSNLYHVKAELFDCYYMYHADAPGPLFSKMHDPKCADRKMYDRQCYKTPYTVHRVCMNGNLTTREKVASKGEKEFEPLSAQLKHRKPLSVFLKVDVEGSEWTALQKLLDSPADLSKIRSIDMEVHINMDDDHERVLSEKKLEKRVRIIERLSQNFAVIGSTLESFHKNLARNFKNDIKKAHKPHIYTANGFSMDMWCISWVNRQLL